MAMQRDSWVQLRDVGIRFSEANKHHAACLYLTEALQHQNEV
jgi:hypothetical protein